MGSRTWRRPLSREHRVSTLRPTTRIISCRIPTALLSMMSCALVFAAMMLCGLAARAPLKKVRRKFVLGDLWMGYCRRIQTVCAVVSVRC